MWWMPNCQWLKKASLSSTPTSAVDFLLITLGCKALTEYCSTTLDITSINLMTVISLSILLVV